MSTLVSVIIPVYNGEKYITQAVESVLAQTHQPIEIIVVDDGSTDSSVAKLTEFSNAIVVLKQANVGVGAARNAGIVAANGDLVGFLDQDDWWLPRKLELQLRVFQDAANCGLVHTAVQHFDDQTEALVRPLNPNARPDLMVGSCYERLLLGNSICNSSVVVRRSALSQVGGCDCTMGRNNVQDYDLWLRIAKHWHVGYVAEPVTVFRLHPAQGTWKRRNMREHELALLRKVRPDTAWRQTSEGRKRMAALHDALGTACYDMGDVHSARRCFAKVLSYDLSLRGALRLAASCLPVGAGKLIREAVWRLRGTDANKSSRCFFVSRNRVDKEDSDTRADF
jgi:glycosyltransferase involved in cell wall biosynthesis